MLRHGLFEISAVRNVVDFGHSAGFQVNVRNVGRRARTEVAQLDLNDLIGSVVTPAKELRGSGDWQ
jgi:hypothetical protein